MCVGITLSVIKKGILQHTPCQELYCRSSSDLTIYDTVNKIRDFHCNDISNIPIVQTDCLFLKGNSRLRSKSKVVEILVEMEFLKFLEGNPVGDSNGHEWEDGGAYSWYRCHVRGKGSS